MGIETGDTIATLNEAWPDGSEKHSEGDDHIRQLKHVLKLDALSKAAGGSITGPVALANGSTIGGNPIASTADLGSVTPAAHTHTQTDITDLSSDLAAKAPLDSPTFSGVPTAPTAAEGTSTGQIATTAFVAAEIAAIEPGGGGGGDDLDTTPVAATGSTLDRPMPDWLAGAPVVEIAEDVVVTADHRGVWLHMMNDIGSLIHLADDWEAGMAFGARQVGIGQTQWTVVGGATVQLPFSRATHTGISEQYEEVVFRVISNVDGESAVWGVSGGTI